MDKATEERLLQLYEEVTTPDTDYGTSVESFNDDDDVRDPTFYAESSNSDSDNDHVNESINNTVDVITTLNSPDDLRVDDDNDQQDDTLEIPNFGFDNTQPRIQLKFGNTPSAAQWFEKLCDE